jgi:hypothetical protein
MYKQTTLLTMNIGISGIGGYSSGSVSNQPRQICRFN